MAKKQSSKVNKSAQIRAYLESHPNERPSSVASALNERMRRRGSNRPICQRGKLIDTLVVVLLELNRGSTTVNVPLIETLQELGVVEVIHIHDH